MEQHKGMLKEGFLCDLAVLDRDILNTHQLDQIKVLYTVIGGRVFPIQTNNVSKL